MAAAAFGHWRSRYMVAGRGVYERLGRKGVPAQQLRANAALVLEWFRILLRHDWLGSHRRRNPNEPLNIRARGHAALERVKRARKKRGLQYPYGHASRVLVEMGLLPPPAAPLACQGGQ